jgi:hypothetical protein
MTVPEAPGPAGGPVIGPVPGLERAEGLVRGDRRVGREGLVRG